LWKPPGGTFRGGAEVRSAQFRGTLGPSPISIAAGRIRFALEGPALSATDVDVRLGREEWVHRLEINELTGRFNAAGAFGRFNGLSGQVARVPLLLGEGSGSWRVQRGDLLVEGRILVSDARDPPRFHPLVSDDFRLTLADKQIRAAGWLKHPASGIRVTRATIHHDLRNEAGRAVLEVPGIRFALDGLQPEDITPLSVGVVALVEGTVTGRGEVNWRPGSTSSSGTFSTENMNLAASFGPVEGLTTTIRFTDLLNLVSAPGQVAEVDLIRAGIDVADGVIRYQLLPDSHVRIEGGRWPLAGGELLLEPTLLDFGQPSTKFLTFEVIGLDAARFVSQLGISSIALTGTFDGVLPMRFDVRGGHIVGGKLQARPGGGTLSYVGVVSDADLGTYGRLAFDALKSLRYSYFLVELDGALAGEFLTRIQLHGVTVANRDHWLVRQFANLPFRFNIAIRGPLRAVIATARATSDPTLLIQPVLPEELRDLPTTVTTIRKEESETQR
ncbi:MAG: YdbH domain-containing protein, partial [Pseudomonadota bacterium]|nr:YdbH domain-containing protein [Pseudomonadota bacterium]